MTGNLRNREDGGWSSSIPLVFVPKRLQKGIGWETILKIIMADEFPEIRKNMSSQVKKFHVVLEMMIFVNPYVVKSQ